MNMQFEREMPTARVIREMYPLSAEALRRKEENDAALRQVFTGESDKFILIVGPCSADREEAVLEYVHRLADLRSEVADKLILVPRVYTNKPRTTGAGYKGMLHQPDPTTAPDMLKGLIAIRKLHVRIMEETGLSAADEMLYPENYLYLSDCLSYVAVGARSVENQLHRLVSSGLDIPVGMKNPTGGDLSVMMNAISAARHAHTFAYAGWEVKSQGNPLAHAILRGYASKHGQSLPNYHFEDLVLLCELFEKGGFDAPAVIVDTNHANSGKHFAEQPRIASEVLHSMRHHEGVAKLVKGLMMESYLVDGCQSSDGQEYGKSITDPCLGWEKTHDTILQIADKL